MNFARTFRNNLAIRILKWFTLIVSLTVIIGYHAFVQWRYSKLPENRSPSAARFSDRIQKVYWHTAFGDAPMVMKPYPFWKFLISIPNLLRDHGENPPYFSAASKVSKMVIHSRSPQQRTRTMEAQFTFLFMAIWVSKHWAAEDVINTILAQGYYCHDFVGIENAAIGYYGLAAEELTNEELVFLAGILERSCFYSPWIEPEKAERRASYLLKKTHAMGLIPVKEDPKECFKRLLAPKSLEKAQE
jgi:hypothetical protein